MFVIYQAKVSDLNCLIKQGAFITSYKTNKLGLPVKPTIFSYKRLKNISNNIFYTMDSDNQNIIATIAGRRASAEEVECISGTTKSSYIIEIAHFNSGLKSLYNEDSIKNMARLLVRTFLADKNSFNVYIDITDDGITNNDILMDALRYNDFYMMDVDEKNTYVRDASSMKFIQYYN